MSLKLICGRSGSGKSEYCLNETLENINGNNKIYIITPEQFSYSVEKKLLDKCETGAIINAEVLTFKRMAYRVANEVRNNK
jgi:ATP-dependent helicase/nuclease subunit B